MNHISSHITKRTMLINLCTVVLIMIHGVESVSLKQPQKVLMKQKGKSVSIKCEVTDLSSGGYVHWYHKKKGEKGDETFKRLLYISESGIATSEAKDIVSEKTGESYGIKLKNIKDEHAGVYYCASWDGSRKVFGSGTRLYVAETGKDKFVAPKLSGYLPSTKDADKNNKQTMLCQASGMFPDLVKFAWKKNNSEEWTDVSEGDVVEQTNESPVIVTSMMIVDKDVAKNNKYQCIVTHEGNTAAPQTLEMKKDDVQKTSVTRCPPRTDETIKKQISGYSEQIPSMFLFVYAYDVLLMKNGLFFCIVSIFLLKRKAGKKDESS